MREKKSHKMTSGFRKIHESRCAEPSCEFFEKPAQQGVCYSRISGVSDKYIHSVRKYADVRMEEVKSLRKANKLETDAKWIKYLESNLECCWMNEEFTLDQLISLRAQVGKLTNLLESIRAEAIRNDPRYRR